MEGSISWCDIVKELPLEGLEVKFEENLIVVEKNIYINYHKEGDSIIYDDNTLLCPEDMIRVKCEECSGMFTMKYLGYDDHIEEFKQFVKIVINSITK